MSAHTPGPWHLRIDEPAAPGFSTHAWIQGSADTGFKGDRYLSVSGLCELADAHLIAAAPELLEFAQRVECRIAALAHVGVSLDNDMQSIWGEAREVIAKATGESA